LEEQRFGGEAIGNSGRGLSDEGFAGLLVAGELGVSASGYADALIRQ
jgi:hypothetical protein